MARKRDKKSKLSFWGLGLTKEQEEAFKKKLEIRGYTARQTIRGLIIKWSNNEDPDY